MVKLLIELEGGLLSRVICNVPGVKLVVIDYDEGANIEWSEGENHVSDLFPVEHGSDISEYFACDDPDAPNNAVIFESLLDLGFDK